MNIISQDIITSIIQQYSLPLTGIHGVAHWARVFENGTRLAEHTGANVKVVQLFALFHDSKRRNEHFDWRHGLRGAKYAKSLRETVLQYLSDDEFDLLYIACAKHTDGLTDGDITVQTCWDADRLDLNRVGILPQPKRLCTPAAKTLNILTWANERAASEAFPGFAIRWMDWPFGGENNGKNYHKYASS